MSQIESFEDRLKNTLGVLTEPPQMTDRQTRPDIGARQRSRTFLAGAVASVLLLVFGAAVLLNRGGSSNSVVSTCGDQVSIDGRQYVRDDRNVGLPISLISTELEEVHAVLPCTDEEVPEAGVLATQLPIGTVLWSIETEPTRSTVAASVNGQLVLYRSIDSDIDPLEFSSDVLSIEINGAADGLTTIATNSDRQQVTRLIDSARSSPTGSADKTAISTDYIIALVRADGLVTAIPYNAQENVLGTRKLDALWHDAVKLSIEQSPPAAIDDRVKLVGARGTATFHPPGACIVDRVDLSITRGETLQTVLADGVTVGFFFSDAIEPVEPDGSGKIQINADHDVVVLEVALADTGATLCTVLSVQQ